MDRKITISLLNLRRLASLASSALFVIFLVYSTPHRVHHLFDRFERSFSAVTGDHRSHNDARNASAKEISCVFQAAVKSCQMSLISLVDFSSIPLLNELFVQSRIHVRFHFASNAFHIRAPPEA